jgi:Ca-activated chloride channel family protein
MIALAPEIDGWFLLDPWFLFFVPLLLLAVLMCFLRERAALPAAQTGLFADLPKTLRVRCVRVPLVLMALGGLILNVALARPVRRELVPQQEAGIDIALVVDLSSSMQIEDMDNLRPVRRIDAARQRAKEFAATRTHDRVAFIAFSRFAELRCPPTLDEKALAAFLSAIDAVPQNSELDGTATGVAVAKAVSVMAKSVAKSRVIVLLTDGETTVDTITVEDAEKLAADAKIRIHTIGIGRGQPTFGGFIPLEFKDLKRLSEKTGGRFFEAQTDADLAQVYEQIDALEKTELDDPRYRTVDGFALPLGLGLLTFLLGLLIELLVIRGVP